MSFWRDLYFGKNWSLECALVPEDERDAFDRYLDEISLFDQLEFQVSPEEEVDLAPLIRSGDKKALDRLIKPNLKIVVSVAKEYMYHWLPIMDLIGEGNRWIVKGACTFDETKWTKFSSRAVNSIRACILAALTENSRIIKLPKNVYDAIYAIKKKSKKNKQHLSYDEILEICDKKKTQLSYVVPYLPDRIFRNTNFSLSEPDESDFPWWLYPPRCSNNTEIPDFLCIKKDIKKRINETLCAILNLEEMLILNHYYWLDDCEKLTCWEIEQRLEIKNAQLKLKGMKKRIRQSVDASELEELLQIYVSMTPNSPKDKNDKSWKENPSRIGELYDIYIWWSSIASLSA